MLPRWQPASFIQYRYTITLLHYYPITLLHYYPITLTLLHLHYYNITVLHYALLHYYTTTLLHYYTITLLPYYTYTITPLPYYTMHYYTITWKAMFEGRSNKINTCLMLFETNSFIIHLLVWLLTNIIIVLFRSVLFTVTIWRNARVITPTPPTTANRAVWQQLLGDYSHPTYCRY